MKHLWHAAPALALTANAALAQCDQPWFAPRVVPARPAVTVDADGAGRPEVASLDDDGVTIWTLDTGAHPTRSIVFDGIPGAGLAAADFTGDGVEDLAAITIYAPRLRIFANGGDSWTQVSSPPAINGPISLFDLHGDGDTDIVVTGLDSTNVYANSGGGVFALGVPLVATGVAALWPAEINGDALDDLLLEVTPGSTVAYLQQPDGSFTAGPAAALSPDLVGDLDGDGLADLLAGALLHPGRGDGAFGEPSEVLHEHASPELLADLDADGDPDVLATEPDLGDIAYLNDAGAFTPRLLPTIALSRPQARDMDRDGVADLLNETGAGVAIFRGRGDGTFHTPSTNESLSLIRRVLATDFDGDGDSDVVAVGVAALRSEPAIAFLENTGAGRLEAAALYSMTGHAYEAPIAQDFDADGDPDVAVWSDDSILLYENTPDGQFSRRRALDAPGNYLDMNCFAADLDGNNLPDLVLVNDHQDRAIRIEFNLGRWSFARTVLQSSHPIPIGIADMTGDGSRDLLLLNEDPYDTRIGILPGRGDGTFGDLIDTGATGRYFRVYPGDFDGDGDTDLLGTQSSIDLLVNDGAGHLEDMGSVASYREPGHVGVADFNADGADDFVAGSSAERDEAAIHLSRADGTFTEGIPVWALGAFESAAPADMNRDGAPDLVIAQNAVAGALVTVMLNLCGGDICPPDLNHDGEANTIDAVAFLRLWAARLPAADWNHDGLVNTADLTAFLDEWVDGCP